MKFKILILPLILLFFTVSLGFSQTGIPFKELKSIDDELLGFYKHYSQLGDISNLSNQFAACFAVAKNGNLVYNRCVGVSGFRLFNGFISSKTSDRIRLASITKVVTVHAIKKLVDNGSLKYDDKIFGSKGILKHLLNNCSNVDSRACDITVADLVNHNSGLGRTREDARGNKHNIDVGFCGNIWSSIYRKLKFGLDWDPGETRSPIPATDGGTIKSSYSNVSYWLAGQVIEKITGKTYDNYVRDNILGPIGATSFGLTTENHPNEVSYFDKDASNNNCNKNLTSFGGMAATAEDVVKMRVASYSGGSGNADISSLNVLNIQGSYIAHGGLWNGSRTMLGNVRHKGDYYSFAFLTSTRYNGRKENITGYFGNTGKLKDVYSSEVRNFGYKIIPTILNWPDVDIFDYIYLANEPAMTKNLNKQVRGAVFENWVANKGSSTNLRYDRSVSIRSRLHIKPGARLHIYSNSTASISRKLSSKKTDLLKEPVEDRSLNEDSFVTYSKVEAYKDEPDLGINQSIFFYPNPSKGKVKLLLSESIIKDKNKTLNIYSLDGRLVMSLYSSEIQNNMELSLEHIKGHQVLLVKLQLSNQLITKRLLIVN